MDGRLNIPAADALVKVTRADGRVTYLRVPGEHLQRLMDIANSEFGEKAVILGGPKLVKPHA